MILSYLRHANKSLKELRLCNVCLEEKSVFYSLECNHLFCKDCWTEHLKTAARTEGERVLVTCKCPQFPNCNYIPDETVWEILAQPNEVKNVSKPIIIILREIQFRFH